AASRGDRREYRDLRSGYRSLGGRFRRGEQWGKRVGAVGRSGEKAWSREGKRFPQSAGTVRSIAQARNSAICSAITTESGRVERISSSTCRAPIGSPSACAL